MKRKVDVEEVANRILDTFKTDVRTDEQFDQLCDIVEDTLSGTSRDPKRLCRLIGASRLTPDIVIATLLTLLNQPFQRARGKLVPYEAPQPKAEPVGFTDMSLGAAGDPRPAVDIDDVVLDTRPK